MHALMQTRSQKLEARSTLQLQVLTDVQIQMYRIQMLQCTVRVDRMCAAKHASVDRHVDVIMKRRTVRQHEADNFGFYILVLDVRCQTRLLLLSTTTTTTTTYNTTTLQLQHDKQHDTRHLATSPG